MNSNISKIWLFTVSACPTGRNIGTVLRELQVQHSEVEFATHFFDIQPEVANRYRIKENPTVLFLDSDDNELYRFIGFKETEEVNQLIDQLEKGNWQAADALPENLSSRETYTIFLYQKDQPVPVEVEYRNPTSIRTPRITAIQLLISSQFKGYENPFPPDTSLSLVQFPQNDGCIYLSVKTNLSESTQKKMRTVLTRTLEQFGVTTVKMILEPSVS